MSSTFPRDNKKQISSTDQLFQIVEDNHRGRPVGIYSICSANRYVLQAGMLQGLRDRSLLCIESTANQVNQFGGYTGQTPSDFAAYVREIAGAADFPLSRIVLGGDHLGPLVWRQERAEAAMAKAGELVRSCVRAGYTKIHLDASMRCADDPGDRHRPLPDEMVSARAAELCQAAEQAYRQLPPDSPAPLYIVGTEVPIPGGEQLGSEAPATTSTEHLAGTLALAKEAFFARGLQSAWERVIAVVVQPGVEFGDSSVFPYDRKKARQLSEYAAKNWQGVFEAHSTDYQTSDALRRMVEDHFAILKVGPWLTFAFREAVFALAAIEGEWLGPKKGIRSSHIRETLEAAMLENPAHWQSYYQGDAAELQFARKYSYSDRSRYYWAQPQVAEALERLIANLIAQPAPISVISQFLPAQTVAIRGSALVNDPEALIRAKILEVIDVYAFACGMSSAA
jgi:D-tagatose-1,6-bisphosphate aldolase subunit GatZ/KbaZ